LEIYVQKIAELNHEIITLWFLHYCVLVVMGKTTTQTIYQRM